MPSIPFAVSMISRPMAVSSSEGVGVGGGSARFAGPQKGGAVADGIQLDRQQAQEAGAAHQGGFPVLLGHGDQTDAGVDDAAPAVLVALLVGAGSQHPAQQAAALAQLRLAVEVLHLDAPVRVQAL